jgi:hypothetical protein
MVAHSITRFPQRHDLCMSSRIEPGNVAVPSTTNNFPSSDDHRSYWNLACFQGSLRAAQGFFHPQLVASGFRGG